MTYLDFHLMFTIPAIVLLAATMPSGLAFDEKVARRGLLTIIVLAFVYTSPWDNYLVMRGVWEYAPGSVLLTIGYVPIEEYVFFMLQPLLTGLWFFRLLDHLGRERSASSRRVNVVGAVICFGLALLGVWMVLRWDEQFLYLGLILGWALPVIGLQWAIGGGQVWHNGKLALLGILPPTLYLAAVDRIAIQTGTWHIVPATSTGINVLGLPVEELLFFVVTNVMVVQGLLLFQWVMANKPEMPGWLAQLRLRPVRPQIRVSRDAALSVSPEVREVLNHTVFRWSWLVLVAVTVMYLLGLELPFWVQILPLGLSAVFLGLPHGAVDHLVPGQINGRRLRRGQMAALLAGYSGLVIVMLVVWQVVPLLAFVGFILITWLHWGLGDLHTTLAMQGGRFLDSRLQRGLVALTRGALPMLLPLVAFPADYQAVMGGITAAVGGVTPGAGAAVFSAGVQQIVVTGVACGVFMSLGLSFTSALWRGGMREWLVFAGETLLLVVFFLVVPSFFAVGLYFCIWHSARHIARLSLLDDDSADDVRAGRVWLALGRFMRRALPMTLMALAMLAALYVLVPVKPDTAVSSVGLYLMLISALTLPHMVIVFWMDLAEGVWSVDNFPVKPATLSEKAVS